MNQMAMTLDHDFRRIKRMEKVRSEFLGNVTHELKTPITTVGVAIEAMSSFNALNDPEKTKEYLQISKHELNDKQ